jgi:hypothetical protein
MNISGIVKVRKTLPTHPQQLGRLGDLQGIGFWYNGGGGGGSARPRGGTVTTTTDGGGGIGGR